MSAREAALRADSVTRSYGRRRVLRGTSLQLMPGELVALLGPNGSGKTTLMKVLVGLLDTDSGSVSGARASDVGWVPQGGATWQRLTVRENLELFVRLLRLPGDAPALARRAAEAAHLSPWYESLASELSGGLRQRLSVAVGLLGDPRVLVLDEPTTGVDLLHRTALFEFLRERAAEGCAVLYSTHSLEDAAWADRVAVLVDGRITFEGRLAQVAAFAGEPAGDMDASELSRGMLALWQATDEGGA